LEEQIEPLESHGEKSLEKQLKKNLSKVELLWEECLARQKHSQVSQSKTPLSTLDTPDVLGVKDKKEHPTKHITGFGYVVNLPSSQARTEINNSHANSELLAYELPNLKETQPLPESSLMKF
jgi:hypothetical protein